MGIAFAMKGQKSKHSTSEKYDVRYMMSLVVGKRTESRTFIELTRE